MGFGRDDASKEGEEHAQRGEVTVGGNLLMPEGLVGCVHERCYLGDSFHSLLSLSLLYKTFAHYRGVK